MRSTGPCILPVAPVSCGTRLHKGTSRLSHYRYISFSETFAIIHLGCAKRLKFLANAYS